MRQVREPHIIPTPRKLVFKKEAVALEAFALRYDPGLQETADMFRRELYA